MAIERSVYWDKPVDTAQSALEMLKFMQQSMISIATEERIQAETEGFDEKAVIRTDNKWFAPLSTIKPFGKVEWSTRAIPADVIINIYAKIIKNSPVLTGKYAKANLVYIGKKMVARTMGELEAYLKANKVGAKNTIRFINSMPYARKLERYAITSSRRARKVRTSKSKRYGQIRKPNGVYALSARSAKTLFGQIGFVEYKNFANGTDGIILPNPPSGMRTTYSGGRTPGRPYVYPSIRIKPFERGIIQ